MSGGRSFELRQPSGFGRIFWRPGRSTQGGHDGTDKKRGECPESSGSRDPSNFFGRLYDLLLRLIDLLTEFLHLLIDLRFGQIRVVRQEGR